MTAADFQRDLIAVISDSQVNFTWGGTVYVGTIGTLATTKNLQEGGFLTEPDLSLITCLKKLDASNALVNRFAAALPACNEKITSVNGVSGADYRIERVTLDEYGAGIQLDLMSLHK